MYTNDHSSKLYLPLFCGCRCSVFDSNATIVSDDKRNIVIYAWYDNEFGYTKQVIRLAKYAANVRRSLYY